MRPTKFECRIRNPHGEWLVWFKGPFEGFMSQKRTPVAEPGSMFYRFFGPDEPMDMPRILVLEFRYVRVEGDTVVYEFWRAER